MQTPLLQTKLYIPQSRPSSSNLILRPRLMERLNEGLSGKLTLLSAPAGFGKTTLVSEWASQSKTPVAWLSLEETDNDLTRFLGYVIAALQTCYPHLGETVPAMMQSPQPPLLDSLLTILINDIAAIPEDLVLVLDDYHVITSPPIQQALTFLLDHLPSQLHLAITTRADPPFPLARMRARGEMVEIREADLRFTKAETFAFLQQVMNIELSADDLIALHHRTEGWITGLHLAALSMQGSKDAREFVQTFTGGHQYILDYLLEEVFRRQSASSQTFLLQTSILERLCGSLCDAVMGRDDGQTMLETLAQANLFILPLDDERHWYRYHHLFADLLRHRLQQTLPAQWPDLHRRAATWYEQHGFINEAIHHALQAEAYPEAARLVEVNAFTALKQGEVMTVLGWLDRLPQETVHAHPWLSVWHAWALLLTGQVVQLSRMG
jgi:LuxR family maltose regulon positive regulatory protein